MWKLLYECKRISADEAISFLEKHLPVLPEGEKVMEALRNGEDVQNTLESLYKVL